MGQLTARQTARRAALVARVSDHHPLGAGLTVDTTHVVPVGAESRQSLYVAMTRGRSENHIYLADAAVEPDSLAGVDSLNHDRRGHPGRHPPARQRADLGHQHPPHPGRAGGPNCATRSCATKMPWAARRTMCSAKHSSPPSTKSPSSSSPGSPPTRLPHPAQSSCAAGARRPTRVLRRSAELHELVTADDPAAVLDWRISHSPTQPGPLYPNGCATTGLGRLPHRSRASGA